MDEKIKSLWENNKLLFLLLLPLIALYLFRSVIFDLLASSAHKTADEAKKQDTELSAKETQAKQDAAVAQARADDDQKRIDERKQDDINEDWYKTNK